MIWVESFEYNSDRSGVIIKGGDEDSTYEIRALIYDDSAILFETNDDTHVMLPPRSLNSIVLYNKLRIKNNKILHTALDNVKGKLCFADWLIQMYSVAEDYISEHEITDFENRYIEYVYELPWFFAAAIIRENLFNTNKKEEN